MWPFSSAPKLNFDEYVKQNPACLVDGEIKCKKCGSKRIHTDPKGSMGADSIYYTNLTRNVSCEQCGETLYSL